MSYTPGSLQPGVPQTPHIRLNSGSGGDLLTGSISSSSQDSAQQVSRSLTPAGRPGQYSQNSAESAADLLLPPGAAPRRFRDVQSPTESARNGGDTLSRRTSWSSGSAGSSDSRAGPFASPFDDSRSPSRADSDDDGLNTQTVSEKYNITPSSGLLLFPEDVEKDDWLHNPDPNDKSDKLTCSDLCSKRGAVNVGGLAFILVGIMMLFIGYPILTFVRKAIDPVGNVCEDDPMCISASRPLLKNLRTSAIDPKTPQSARTRKGVNGDTLKLVFSDEFDDDGRTFYDGDDPFFQGVDIWYGVTQDLEWYDPDAITTQDGVLTIRFDAFQSHNLNYRSGMLQSWNKLCFKGGHLEASISLPGTGETSGFWPGFWAMGNLGRPGYPSTTDGMWPYSYEDVCDAGITPNQSDPSGLSFLPGMKLPACTCEGTDHPNPGKSRSAPEIDAIEASVDPKLSTGGKIGTASQSYQIAPFDIFYSPNIEFTEIYDYSVTSPNVYRGGVYQQALSSVTNLNLDWYDGNGYQTYAFEYTPGSDGDITWFVGDTPTWKVTSDALGPNGNIGRRPIPNEPLSIISNFGMSASFAQLDMQALMAAMPATMRIDYIRIYQDDDGELTCDPVGYPTTEYIASHPESYNNPNKTLWDATSYEWPQNKLVHGC